MTYCVSRGLAPLRRGEGEAYLVSDVVDDAVCGLGLVRVRVGVTVFLVDVVGVVSHLGEVLFEVLEVVVEGEESRDRFRR